MTVPRSTLRLQFHRDFTFDDAANHLDYYAELGISHLYASPITTSQPGSMHGYDTVDYARVNPELGGEEALRRLVDGLRARGMGLIVDIVPNHMGVGGERNQWWLDILEWGRHSIFARYFDVDWHSPDPVLRGKVLAPFLGGPYGDELAAGNIKLAFDAQRGQLYVSYYSHRFPVCPSEYPAILGAAKREELVEPARAFAGLSTHPEDQQRARSAQAALAHGAARAAQAIDATLAVYSSDTPEGRDQLHRLLEKQHYRLAWWRAAADEINWRRFFDISALAGMHVERPEVFAASHALVFRLYAEGLIDGVRVDHVDGLAEPREYCVRLHQRLVELTAQRPGPLAQEPPYLVVEKILARGEPMREDWRIDGTTGYDFMNDVGALLHDPAGAEPLSRAWTEITGRSADFAVEEVAARRKILAENLAAEVDRTARALHRIARDSLATRDFSLGAIRRVLTELVVHFPVYRIYPVNGLRSAEDNRYFDAARDAARRELRAADHLLLDHLDAWLGGAGAAEGGGAGAAALQPGGGQALRRNALVLFSQLTSPAAAKSVEDTAFYRYGRLISRNEVGATPSDFAMTVDAFHEASAHRARAFPQALLSTATHDHKRGEDMRARLAVLSEIPEEWIAAWTAWSALNAPCRRGGDSADWAPGPVAESMLYQTLLGAWPADLRPDDDAGVQALAERVAQWQEKGLREAKLRTDWFAPDAAYETACHDFLFEILAPGRRDGFRQALAGFARRISAAGALNSLQQTVLRLTTPGVPDLYQGTDFWDLSLVDPDNRRPVDYALRKRTLGAAPPSAYLGDWHDARVKQHVIHRALMQRNRQAALFTDGTYLPLTITGPRAAMAMAFARRLGDACALVVVTRLAMACLDGADTPLVDPAQWRDTAITLPPDWPRRTLNDCFSDATHEGGPGSLPLAAVLASMPVALLV